MKKLATILPALLLLCTLSVSCTDEESALGVNLVDGNTLYSGQQHTLYADRALSVRDDSLLTTNYSFGIIGNWHDATFGRVSATLYTQIALPENTGSINLTNNIIDSVVLTLVKERTYPDTSATYNFHFEVMQLAEALVVDSTHPAYYSTDTLPVVAGARYFDSTVTITPTDTIVSLKLDNSIASILTQSATAEEFVQNTKGLRIRLTDAGDEGMFSINFSAVKTCITVYHHYDTLHATYTFLLGTGASHFMHFEHDYSTSLTGGADSLDGSQTLYLEPLGGYNIFVSFNNAVQAFAAAHPTATVHHAELLMPVDASATGMRPDRILALSKSENGNDDYINDLIDPYTLSGFDGKYDEARGCYRLRVTQHVQGMLRKGKDLGTLMVLNSRRSDAASTIINGPSAANPIRIEIIFSE